jgi:CheY-like chemotaxis protein
VTAVEAQGALGEPAAELDPERDLAGALHEVSNALTVVMGWLEAAEERLPQGAAREALEIARQHAELGYRVARRAVGAEVSRDQERTALSLARDAVIAVRPEAQRRGVRIVMQRTGTRDAQLHNPAIAQQIVLNLLLNAIQFTPEGRTVSLVLSFDEDGPVFVVVDQGPGIPAERAQGLLSSPESTRRGGAGIGLRYSSALARANGGSLRLLESGPGASFELRWPAGEAKSGPKHNDAALGSLAGRRVLVVEDDQAVVSLIDLALSARGALVVAASSRAVLDDVCTGSERFDVALVDLSPIADDVAGALGGLRRMSPLLPMILISGVASGIPDGVDGEFAEWVRKPFTMDEVVSALVRAFEGRGLETSAASQASRE